MQPKPRTFWPRWPLPCVLPGKRYEGGMKSPKQKLTPGKLKRWRVSILRSRAHNLGTVEAPDAKAAEAEAVKLFGLTKEQRKRLAVSERS